MNEYRDIPLDNNENSFLKFPEQLLTYLNNKNVFLNRIVENALVSIVIWTLDGRVAWCNKYAWAMAGFTEDDLNGTINVQSIIPLDIVCGIKEISSSIEEINLKYKYKTTEVLKNGNLIYITWRHYMIRDDEGKEYIVSTGIDVTNLRNAEIQLNEVNNNLTTANEELVAQQEELSAMNEELMAQEEELKNNLNELQKHQEALKKSEERYRLVVEGSSNGLWDWDLIDDTVYISESWSNMLGFEKQVICNYGEKWIKLIHPKDSNRFTLNLNKCMEENNPFYLCEYRIKLKNGSYIWISSKGKILKNENGKPVRIAGSHTDITERKKTESKLKHLAYYDPLTDIPLRTIFMGRLSDSIAAAKKNGLKLAVLFLDVDNFKAINDTYGHHIGDKLLKRIVGKLKSCIRNSDTLSRIGGDEFALLVPDLPKIDDVDEMAKRIIELFNEPLNINGHKLYTTISIGISVYPDSGRNGKTLIKKADIAMYKAKEGGKNSLCYYNNIMSREASLRNDIKKDLKTAIENGEFFLCYQPLVDIATNKVVCVEALIRWRNPKKGIISPVEFIPITEETRLIIPIGEWVLETACKQLKEWYEMGSDLGLSVNVSIIQLEQPNFVEVVSRILLETSLPPEYLELEITESVLMESNHTVVRNLDYLKKQGVKVSIDDFGTGYCCLEYLQKVAINSLKIDRTFVQNINVEVNKAIIDTVISLGHKINVKITAEGVETKGQYDYLKKKGCDKVQGYYFSKPLLPEEVIEVLEANNN